MTRPAVKAPYVASHLSTTRARTRTRACAVQLSKCRRRVAPLALASQTVRNVPPRHGCPLPAHAWPPTSLLGGGHVGRAAMQSAVAMCRCRLSAPPHQRGCCRRGRQHRPAQATVHAVVPPRDMQPPQNCNMRMPCEHAGAECLLGLLLLLLPCLCPQRQPPSMSDVGCLQGGGIVRAWSRASACVGPRHTFPGVCEGRLRARARVWGGCMHEGTPEWGTVPEWASQSKWEEEGDAYHAAQCV